MAFWIKRCWLPRWDAGAGDAGLGVFIHGS